MAEQHELVVIVPSRGRPEQAAQLQFAFGETCTAATQLVFALDDTDPTLYGYRKFAMAYDVGPSTTMNEALQRAAAHNVATRRPFAVGFMGDDHRPRTVGWDSAYLAALRELGAGLVYGNDLLQGERLPTQVAMTADIVRALGRMAPTELRHLYLDDYWLALGRTAQAIRYLPDVIVEHVHPAAGKTAWTDQYRKVNDTAMYEHDQAALGAYIDRGDLARDVASVRALRAHALDAR